MKTNWLFPEEHAVVVQQLLKYGLIKFDNKRQLPLKSGGKTDVYINLRDARNNPEAIKFVANLFKRPLETLGVQRFVEVPDAVSCFAGPLSVATGLPYLTIREKPKQGRVADASIIGQSRLGEKVCIFDDVITDGASKIVPYKQCLKMGLDVSSLVVLVDREQGWQDNLAIHDLDLNVWAGMTLHDVRRELIQCGIMERCDAAVEQRNPLIIALDGKSRHELLPLLDQLRTTGCILKVNDLLFSKGIHGLIPELSVYGRVMADLKCHDIPQTVANTCARLAHHNPWAVTVHGSGGKAMIQAAVKALEATSTKVLAVTVLTSIDSQTCEEIYQRLPMVQVLTLAKIAQEAGAHGLVCSPLEIQILKSEFPEMILVTPGIRSAGKASDDQARFSTPQFAKEWGANYVVMGRQILEAPDPVAEVNRILEEELFIV